MEPDNEVVDVLSDGYRRRLRRIRLTTANRSRFVQGQGRARECRLATRMRDGRVRCGHQDPPTAWGVLGGVT